MQDIKDLTLVEFEKYLNDLGYPVFHSRQVFSWIYKKGAVDFAAMSDLSADLRKKLKEDFYILGAKLIKIAQSEDGTRKLILEFKTPGGDLARTGFVEAVNIPVEKRVTGCISSQIGCKFGCKFCASGKLGFKRNLSCGEIIEEILFLKNNSQDKKLTHLVFMGVGEPLDNYDNLLKAIRIINAPYSFNIGARRITISSCGIIPEIERLSQEDIQVELSISLHSADDKTRSSLMPVNKIFPLKNLISACREYISRTNRQVTFEYILIKGVNSDLPSARKLGIILQGMNCKVNLIPANPIKEFAIEPADKSGVLLFKDCLLERGINVTLRRARGQDINAACGQLRLKYDKK